MKHEENCALTNIPLQIASCQCGRKAGGESVGEVSDGYHTFNELYAHRHALFIALCKVAHEDCGDCSGRGDLCAWRSKLHSDGTMFDGMFIMGLSRVTKSKDDTVVASDTITYHLPISLWDECDFSTTLDRAHEWDGHTSDDVLKRLGEI